MADPSNERRRDPRHHARLVVRFGRQRDAAKAFDTYSTNVSAGGLCLRSISHHEVGECLQLDLTAGEERFTLEGVVAWVLRDTMGVRFVNVRLSDRERLEALVEQLRVEPT